MQVMMSARQGIRAGAGRAALSYGIADDSNYNISWKDRIRPDYDSWNKILRPGHSGLQCREPGNVRKWVETNGLPIPAWQSVDAIDGSSRSVWRTRN